VVAKEVEAGMLVGGVPAKALRKLEDGEAKKVALVKSAISSTG
jgi:hypothetical protein